MSKTAILVVSFGTTYPETRQETIGATEQAIGRAFPEATIFRAFTSTVVIKRIAAKEGQQIDTPTEALARIKAAGFDRLYVQSLHIIPGIEYQRLMTAVDAVRGDFATVIVGQPLLTSFADFVAVTDFMKTLHTPTQPDEAVLFMGHGTAHSAFTTYACLDHMLMGSGYYLGAVESYPDIALEINRLKAAGIRRVTIQPFMIVAGDHAHHDMASSAPDSWQSQLTAAGLTVTPVMTGMGAYAPIQQLFIDHLKNELEGVQA